MRGNLVVGPSRFAPEKADPHKADWVGLHKAPVTLPVQPPDAGGPCDPFAGNEPVAGKLIVDDGGIPLACWLGIAG
jgi:hypothetical protein